QQKANEKNLKLRFKTDSDLPEIKADGFKLEQMLLNLIDNAVKYTDEGSIRVKARQKGKNIRIEIVDTGLGIPQDKAERIFERFYILDKSRSRKVGGTGLGLSIVKHIVNLHKGAITVKGTPGKGTTFTIDLPL
nr:ATP-binding protein [Candidatus Kapabacteria bacterium]